MSRGRFIVSLKDVINSEEILKIKSLLKEGFDINDEVKVNENTATHLESFLKDVQHFLDDIEKII